MLIGNGNRFKITATIKKVYTQPQGGNAVANH